MLASMKAIKRLVSSRWQQWRSSSVFDWYVKSAPSPRNAIEIFKGEWSSRLPAALASLPAGNSLLFEDHRITKAVEQWGGIAGQRVLELGPLEAGHTYMLEQLGAAEIIAVEANTRAYLKCLIVKELLGLKKARFLCGDFVEYLRGDVTRYDACIASGVLYHMFNPVELISLLSRRTDRLLIWTHYFDAAIFRGKPEELSRFGPGIASEYAGFNHTLYRHEYRSARRQMSFCGGTSSSTRWMTRADILSSLHHFGYDDLRIIFEEPNHPKGPCFCLCAQNTNQP